MAASADFSYCWRHILAKQEQLRQFKERLPESVKAWLGSCEWTLIAKAGHQRMPLLILRCPGRVRLRHPLLFELAKSAHTHWEPLDLSIFSAETQEPVRVLSKTLLEINRHQN